MYRAESVWLVGAALALKERRAELTIATESLENESILTDERDFDFFRDEKRI